MNREKDPAANIKPFVIPYQYNHFYQFKLPPLCHPTFVAFAKITYLFGDGIGKWRFLINDKSLYLLSTIAQYLVAINY